MKTLYFLLIMLCLSATIQAQYTAIPDPNFEQALIDLTIDSDGVVNGQVLTTDIENVTHLNVSTKGIGDLTGIEGFVDLEELDISSNSKLDTLILVQNLNLKKLDISFCFDLPNLNLSGNPLLEYLYADINLFFSQLDVSNNPSLKELILGTGTGLSDSNDIQELDLSNNPLLEKLMLRDMPSLKYINLKSGNNIVLEVFDTWCSIEDWSNCTPHVCLEVDDINAANSNAFPYNLWEGDFVYSEDCALGTSDFEKDYFSILPNPVAETLVITHIENREATTVQIYSISNKLLFNNTLDPSYNKIDVSYLSAGLYYMVFENEDGRKSVKKFVKM